MEELEEDKVPFWFKRIFLNLDGKGITREGIMSYILKEYGELSLEEKIRIPGYIVILINRNFIYRKDDEFFKT